ncbi:acetyl-CoA C-acetyltransferase [Thiotrichales bacterium 19S3-7]|nr:acetyl-CoA C-acetyltransferase [Thiotrichales bacterium 19S3-7]MCF6802440.1 acetyl-CoA C-acetyltransferase [Thiotrichales bacterium 19S3-11]
MENVVIVAAYRTPIGNFNGALSTIPAHKLGASVIQHLIHQTKIAPELIDRVIMGQVLTAACGQNPARQAAIAAGLPKETCAMTLNHVCGSGLSAIQMAAQAIRLGDAEVIIAGGQENMSCAPHAVNDSRKGHKMGNWSMIDTMVNDGLWEAFNQYHMGTTAENIAKAYHISREEQDDFAAKSQQKAQQAIESGRFAEEIVPIEIPQRKKESIIFTKDEFPRFDTTKESLSTLRPAFDKQGSVTAGNASGINDGAAAVLLMSESKAKELNVEIMAYIKSYADAGVCPTLMGTGPIPASTKCLQKANWHANDLDLIEANEAFAAQAISVNQAMKWDTAKVNVNGGAIALGHPIGASGARILVTLIHEMEKRDAKKGLATLCIGGGMGTAMAVERQ